MTFTVEIMECSHNLSNRRSTGHSLVEGNYEVLQHVQSIRVLEFDPKFAGESFFYFIFAIMS